MLALLGKIMTKEKLNSGDMLHIFEFAIVTAMVLFGVYTNSKEVPGLKDSVANLQTRTAIVETGQTDMKNSLNNIQDSLGRIENALLNKRGRDQ